MEKYGDAEEVFIPSHDIKTNIRTNSIFENINIQIQIYILSLFFVLLKICLLKKHLLEQITIKNF